MNERETTVDLDLRVLEDLPNASRRVAADLALAASVMLERRHGARDLDPAVIHHDVQLDATIRRVQFEDVDRQWKADPLKTAEQGGEAIAILAAHRVLGRIVVSRLQTETGADYLVRRIDAANGDALERLECSAIGNGSEAATTRLRRKLRQLVRYPDEPAGHAIVTDFGASPVEIRVGSHRDE